jgi:ribosomal protein L4
VESKSQRDAAIRAILEEDATVDLTLADGRLLEARVDNVRSARGLLEDANLELAKARVVVGQSLGHGLERLGSRRVVDLQSAEGGEKNSG